MPLPSPELEFILEARVDVAEPLVIGATPHGERRIVPILGGTFEGPRIRGRVLAGGADWQILRVDGVSELHARYTFQTNAGDLIQVINRGIRHGPPEVMARLRAGERVEPSEYYFRAVPEFETAAPELTWLNRSIFVCNGDRFPSQVVLRFWRLL